GRQRKRTLLARAGHIAICAESANQKLRERHKVIKLPVVQARTKQIRKESALRSGGPDGAGEPVVPEFSGQTQPAIGIVSKRSGAALVVPRSERIARVQMN